MDKLVHQIRQVLKERCQAFSWSVRHHKKGHARNCTDNNNLVKSAFHHGFKNVAWHEGKER
jgi:hypothetical protein